MRKAFRVAVLTLALSCSVYAGDMPFGVAPKGDIPYGVTSTAVAETTTASETATSGSPSNTLTEAALSIINSLLTLF